MSLALPDPVDDAVIARSLTRAQHGVAFTCLTVTLLTLLAVQLSRPMAGLWVPVPVVLAAIFVLVVRWKRPSDVLTAGYLLVAALALFTIEWAKADSVNRELTDASLGVLGMRIALVLCGSARSSVVANTLWTAAGFATAEGAMLAASVATGKPYQLSGVVVACVILVIVLRPLASHVSPRLRAALPQLRQAALDDDAASQHAVLEHRAASLVHDTVLSQLTTIAGTAVGEISPVLRDRIARDVSNLSFDGWLKTVHEADELASAEWQQSPLFAALQDGRLLGLTVETTGDIQALRRVDSDTSMALGLAVAQCLANVLKHAGTTIAEVAVYETESEVCVMVIDTGRGFDQSTTASDRLGLRASVKRRIEQVGGRVQVWSTLGQGTSIMLRVPATPLVAGDAAEVVVEQS